MCCCTSGRGHVHKLSYEFLISTSFSGGVLAEVFPFQTAVKHLVLYIITATYSISRLLVSPRASNNNGILPAWWNNMFSKSCDRDLSMKTAFDDAGL